MILAKSLDVFNGKYDFIDSIVTGLNWDANLLDFLVTIDYFWNAQEDAHDLVIRFVNCREVAITMPKAFDNIPNAELQSYIHSWHTITNCSVTEESGFFKACIKTVDDDPRWLVVTCNDIWLEQKAEIF